MVQNERLFVIEGKKRSGKSRVLSILQKSIQDTNIYPTIIALKGTDDSVEDYYSFRTANENSAVSADLTGYLEFITENDNNHILRSLVYMLSNRKRKLRNSFYNLNDIELGILSKIQELSKLGSLYFFIDDYDKLDRGTKKVIDVLLRNCFLEDDKVFKDCCFFITMPEVRTLPKYLVFSKIELSVIYTQKDFERYLSLPSDAASELFKITNGNIGLAVDLVKQIDFTDNTGIFKEFDSLNEAEQYAFSESIDMRLVPLEDGVKDLLSKASVIGETFEYQLLKTIAKLDEFKLRKYIEVAEKEKILVGSRSDNERYRQETFLSKIIYNYFISKNFEYNYKNHFDIAEAYRILNSSSYFDRYKHYKLAGKTTESLQNAVVYQLLNLLRFDIEPRSDIEQEIRNSPNIGEFYDSWLDIIKKYKDKNNDFIKVLKQLYIVSLSPNTFLDTEKIYFFAFLLYKQGDREDFLLAAAELEKILVLPSECVNELDQWLRISILLYLIQINRLDDTGNAKKTYAKITKMIAEKNQDKAIDYYRSYLSLLSPSILDGNLAEEKIKGAIQNFKTNPFYFNEYIYSLCNISGVCFCLGKFNDGYAYASTALEAIKEVNPDFYKKERIINNLIINGFYCDFVTGEIAEKSLERLNNELNLSEDALLNINKLSFRAINGRVENAANSMESLYNSIGDTRQYHKMILGFNLITMNILLNNFEDSKKYVEELSSFSPSISEPEKDQIDRRIIALTDVIDGNNSVSFEQLSEKLEKSIKDKYWNKPYLLTDLQIWS